MTDAFDEVFSRHSRPFITPQTCSYNKKETKGDGTDTLECADIKQRSLIRVY